MNDLQKEIDELVEYFNEIDIQVAKLKKVKKYKKWLNEPFPKGVYCVSKAFPVTLWRGTDKEKVFRQHISKFTLHHATKK